MTVSDDMIVDMEASKRRNPIVTELFFRGGKLNMSLAFISKSYFKVPKIISLNATPYFVMKIHNKRKLQQIASNHSSDIELKDFMNLYKDYNKEHFQF